MLHYHQIEFLTYERQARLRAEAEAQRRGKVAASQLPATKRLLAQFGARLVQWGHSLQGQSVPLSPDINLPAASYQAN